MSELHVLAAVATPVLVGLAVHVYRDIRGGIRNRSGRCYSCGTWDDAMEWVHHHRGGSYKYCDRCRERHESTKRIAVFSALAAFLLVLGVGALSRTGIPFWVSVLVLGFVAVAVAAIGSLAFRRGSGR
jgi:hypothetical protein